MANKIFHIFTRIGKKTDKYKSVILEYQIKENHVINKLNELTMEKEEEVNKNENS